MHLYMYMYVQMYFDLPICKVRRLYKQPSLVFMLQSFLHWSSDNHMILPPMSHDNHMSFTGHADSSSLHPAPPVARQWMLHHQECCQCWTYETAVALNCDIINGTCYMLKMPMSASRTHTCTCTSKYMCIYSTLHS